MDDELVLEIDITWSDKRENSVKRTLNEVSILERDMRHGKFGDPEFKPRWAIFFFIIFS